MTTIKKICEAAEKKGYIYKIEPHGQNGTTIRLVKRGQSPERHKHIKIELKGVDRQLIFNFAQRAVRPDGLYAMPLCYGDYSLLNFDGPLLSEKDVLAFINAN